MAFQPFDLTGKVALITGGNGGIGLGMAEGLAQAGADVVIWGMNPDKNAAAAEKLKASGRRIIVERVDVTDEAAVVEHVAKAAHDLGRLDFVAANAGMGVRAPSFAEFSTEAWHKVMAVNLDGVFWTLREACKQMVARAEAGDRGGSLLAVSST
jgi:NAD(P)-dependent dehydrogenase (short-subunit alcohol dehydrogenase family)